MEKITYLARSKRSLSFFLMGMISPLIFTILIVYIFQMQTGNYLLSIFEKKTIDNLTSYHQGIKMSTQAYFLRSVQVLENIGKSNRSPVYFTNPKDIQNQLDLILRLNPQFLTIGTADDKGIVRFVASRESIVEAMVGKDLSNRIWYQQAMKSGKTIISDPTIGSVSKIVQIPIAIPLEKDGKTVSVLAGFISLSRLTSDMRLTGKFYDKYGVLADENGTILTGTIPDKDKVMNLTNREPLFDQLASSSKRIIMIDNYNYRAEKVFAMGEKISIGADKNIYLMTYMKKTAFDEERNGLRYTIFKITAYLIVLWIVLNAMLFVVLSRFLYFYDHKK